ncbi:MAG: hypothetical protein ACE141_12390 [Bryobacteraceae bacterium]
MGSVTPGNRGDELDRTLDALFAAYREASPTPEASPDFMPRLWQQIEARRAASYSFGRWTRAMVTAAAALCLLLGLLQVYLPSRSLFYTQTYIEALQEESAEQSPTYLEALWVEDGGGS